jgi:RNA polymerase sigma-70 factor, ECF subfamily
MSKSTARKELTELMRRPRLRIVSSNDPQAPVVDLRETDEDSTTVDLTHAEGASTIGQVGNEHAVNNTKASSTASSNTASARGSIEDLRVLYDLHGAEIFRFCNRLLGDVGAAEEAVQETFLRAWRSASTWDPTIAAKRTWMYAIARNACIDVLRAQRRRIPIDRTRPTHSAAQGQSSNDPLMSPEFGSDDPAFESVMANWMLEEALRRIGPDHREAIVRTYVHDRPYPEVAIELGIPETTLRTRVFYGLRALRKVLEEMGWHE